MKLIRTLPAMILAALAVPALAATELDTDGDGLVTLDEAQAAYPEITPESFTEMDSNADGALDEEEVAAAQDAGKMPKS